MNLARISWARPDRAGHGRSPTPRRPRMMWIPSDSRCSRSVSAAAPPCQSRPVRPAAWTLSYTF